VDVQTERNRNVLKRGGQQQLNTVSDSTFTGDAGHKKKKRPARGKKGSGEDILGVSQRTNRGIKAQTQGETTIRRGN